MRGNFIQTYSGLKFYPLDPRVEDISIIDIAHALSNICRYTGHCRQFYSVAQHSLLVEMYVKKKNRLWALLHDAAEAYINDVAAPIKGMPEFKVYNDMEDNIMSVICEKFGLEKEKPAEVKKHDLLALRTEAEQFGMITPEWFCYDIKPLDVVIIPLSPHNAEEVFLKKFTEIPKK